MPIDALTSTASVATSPRRLVRTVWTMNTAATTP
jgi:hypothetical protein